MSQLPFAQKLTVSGDRVSPPFPVRLSHDFPRADDDPRRAPASRAQSRRVWSDRRRQQQHHQRDPSSPAASGPTDRRCPGRVQYVAEQITGIAPVGILQRGQTIARYASSGTEIEYGWAVLTGQTLASATSYTEGQVTPAGRSVRVWLNSLGAYAGNG